MNRSGLPVGLLLEATRLELLLLQGFEGEGLSLDNRSPFVDVAPVVCRVVALLLVSEGLDLLLLFIQRLLHSVRAELKRVHLPLSN